MNNIKTFENFNNQYIFTYIENNDIKSVKNYIKSGYDLNIKDRYGHTPLINSTFNNEIKIILHNFNNHIKALLPGIKYVKKVAYDKLTGLQVDFVIWIDELNNGKIETAWKRATQPIFPQILCMVYKRKLSNIEQLEMVKNFVHFALRIPCLLETELMLKVPTVRNFTTSRK